MKEILLTQGKVALVDDDDYDYLMQWKWYAQRIGNTYYSIRNSYINRIRGSVYMHRSIMKCTPLEMIDHIDGNGLNNQKINLRIANKQTNARNTRYIHGSVPYKGVLFIKRKTKNVYISRINIDYKQTWLGTYNNPIEAARAYDRAAIKYFGEYASLNFPKSDYENFNGC